MHTLEQISILLVEDDPITARVEQAELENIGYSVHHITTGEEAVDRALYAVPWLHCPGCRGRVSTAAWGGYAPEALEKYK